MIELTPRTEDGITTLDVSVNGKPTKVYIAFDEGGRPTWVPGKGYEGPPTEPSVHVVDERRRKGGGTSFRIIPYSPSLFSDLALDLLHRLT